MLIYESWEKVEDRPLVTSVYFYEATLGKAGTVATTRLQSAPRSFTVLRTSSESGGKSVHLGSPWRRASAGFPLGKSASGKKGSRTCEEINRNV